jgi:hypothetical protein
MEALLKAGSGKYRLRRSGGKGNKWEPLPFVLAREHAGIAAPPSMPLG